ncbi:hypothetical protein IMY05_016G0172600 [Salix suchowensis]|nr:hypothetical protein IMY05_016G0172600 [Salix suchowensis]
MKMVRIMRVIKIISRFFIRICAFRPQFIGSNIVLEAHCLLHGPELREVCKGSVKYENREQMSKGLFNRLGSGRVLIYFNPASEELEGIVPRVRWPRSPVKTSKKVINRKFYSDMEAIRIKGRSSVCDLGGLVSMSGITFLCPFICSTVKVYFENHSASLRSCG